MKKFQTLVYWRFKFLKSSRENKTAVEKQLDGLEVVSY